MVKKKTDLAGILRIAAIIGSGISGMFEGLADHFEKKQGIVQQPTAQDNKLVEQLAGEYE